MKYSIIFLAFLLSLHWGCVPKEEDKPFQVVAEFTFVSNNNFLSPSVITFSNTSENADSYEWYFGNGDVSVDPEPVYKYQQPGTYQVKLVAKNAKSTNRENSKIQTIEIKDPLISGKKIFYFGDRGSKRIHFADLEANNPQIMVFDSCFTSYPVAIAVDESHKKVFVADATPSNGRILVYPTDGSKETLLVEQISKPDVGVPTGIAFINDNVVWTRKNAIMKMYLDGTSLKPLIDLNNSSINYPTEMTYSSELEIFYMTMDSVSSVGGIWGLGYDGGGMREVVSGINASAVAFAQKEGLLFFAWVTKGLYSCDINGDNITRIGDVGVANTRDIVVDQESSFVYWGLRNSETVRDGSVMRASFDGTNVAPWIRNVNPMGMAIGNFQH